MSSHSSATTLQGHFVIYNGDDEMEVVPKEVPEEVPKEVPKVVPQETEEVPKENTMINKRRLGGDGGGVEQEKNEDLPEETGWLTKAMINKRRLGGATVTNRVMTAERLPQLRASTCPLLTID
jgi:hypothetical protein